MIYIPIAGTWERKKANRWTDEGSMFDRHLESLGWDRRADQLGFWSTALAGSRLCLGNGHHVWQYGAGIVKRFLLKNVTWDDRNLVVHSHGGQVLFYALANQEKPILTIRSLVTVGTPVRPDMDDVRKAAKGRVDIHVHMYSIGWGSRFRWLGQGGAFRRGMPEAHFNYTMKGGHSGMLTEEKHVEQIDGVMKTLAMPVKQAHHYLYMLE